MRVDKEALVRIAKDAGLKGISMHMADAAQLNATVYPEIGALLITRGLIEALTPAQLLVVLAHEVSHVEREEYMGCPEGYEWTDVRKACEYKADEDALATIIKKGMDGHIVIETLEAILGDMDDKDDTCSLHPTIKARIENIRRLI